MASGSTTHTRLPDGLELAEAGGAVPCLEIEFDQRDALQIYDPRLFQRGGRGFCERLLKAATRQPGIIKAEVELASASCRIEFVTGSWTALSVADSFVRAVEEASAGSSLLDRIWWWRRRGQWSVLTAVRLSEHVSLWETFETEPAQIRLRRRAVANNRAQGLPSRRRPGRTRWGRGVPRLCLVAPPHHRRLPGRSELRPIPGDG